MSRIDFESRKGPEDIGESARINTYYRTVHDTSRYQQIVLMSIPPGGNVPQELHEFTTQWIYVETGNALAIIDGKNWEMDDGKSITIHPFETHEIINMDEYKDLKMYFIYSPPHHPVGLVQEVQPKSKPGLLIDTKERYKALYNDSILEVL